MKKTLIAATTLAAVLTAAPANAQDRWSVELRAQGAMSTQQIDDEDLETGFGFEATLAYRVQEHLSVYAGWDWINFGAEDAFAGPGMDLEETGYVFGLLFAHPFRSETAGPGYWIRGGATVDHLELENDEGDIVGDSGHGVGWEAAGGVYLPFAGAWTFTPGLRFRSLSRDLDFDGREIPVDMRYLSFEIGIARAF